mmetsp:Transcript_17263/g.37142  ORF Transcript_17263/g.37142 Transcript_17263/m.37142 type:complete len:183 (-) Transcript_17263:79-627(-)
MEPKAGDLDLFLCAEGDLLKVASRPETALANAGCDRCRSEPLPSLPVLSRRGDPTTLQWAAFAPLSKRKTSGGADVEALRDTRPLTAAGRGVVGEGPSPPSLPRLQTKADFGLLSDGGHGVSWGLDPPSPVAGAERGRREAMTAEFRAGPFRLAEVGCGGDLLGPFICGLGTLCKLPRTKCS